MKKNVFNTVIIALIAVFFLSGCMEHRYYQKNHSHSREYNDRHQGRAERGDNDRH